MPVYFSPAPSVTVDTIQQILSAVTAQFSISNIVSFLAGLIAVGIPFVFLWWGTRKGYSSIIGATQSGSMSGLMGGRRRRR